MAVSGKGPLQHGPVPLESEYALVPVGTRVRAGEPVPTSPEHAG